MRYVTLIETLALHQSIIRQSGGSLGVRDLGLLESAIAQPRMTFGGQDLYGSICDKAAALGFALIMNHPFVDGNKRVGHAATEIFLILNDMELLANVNEQEQIIIAIAAGAMTREGFAAWLQNHAVQR